MINTQYSTAQPNPAAQLSPAQPAQLNPAQPSQPSSAHLSSAAQLSPAQLPQPAQLSSVPYSPAQLISAEPSPAKLSSAPTSPAQLKAQPSPAQLRPHTTTHNIQQDRAHNNTQYITRQDEIQQHTTTQADISNSAQLPTCSTHLQNGRLHTQIQIQNSIGTLR